MAYSYNKRWAASTTNKKSKESFKACLHCMSHEMQKTVIYEHHPQKQEEELVRIYWFHYRKKAMKILISRHWCFHRGRRVITLSWPGGLTRIWRAWRSSWSWQSWRPGWCATCPRTPCPRPPRRRAAQGSSSHASSSCSGCSRGAADRLFPFS